MSLQNRQYQNRQYMDQNGVVYVDGAPAEAGSGPTQVAASAINVGGSLVALAGLVATLLGIWGGIVPFIGPSFGYSADGSPSWNMTAAHFVLAVMPACAGVAAGLLMIMVAPRIVAGTGQGSLAIAGGLGVVSGAWFVVGAAAWPVISSASRYFVPAGPLRELAFQVGYAFGPGVLIGLAGGVALGWAALHHSVSVTLVGTHGGFRRTAIPQASEAIRPTGGPVAPPGAGAAPVVDGQTVVTSQPVAAATTPQPAGTPFLAP
jgi:hypothetical protein